MKLTSAELCRRIGGKYNSKTRECNVSLDCNEMKDAISNAISSGCPSRGRELWEEFDSDTLSGLYKIQHLIENICKASKRK